MLRIMKYLSKAEIGQMLIALVTIVGQVYFDLKLPDYMSDITTLVETPGSHMKDIWIAGGKMLLISLGSAACAIITGYIAARVAASFTQRLRSLEFRKVESFGPAEMSKFSTASLITRSTNDVTQVQMFITMGLQLIVKSPIMAVWAVCKIAGEGFEWTLATGIAVVILLAAIVIMMAMVMPKFKAMQALTDNINLVARENLTGLRVVRAYNAEDYQEAKFTKANKDLTDTQLFTNRVMAFMMPLMNTIMNGLMLAVYWIGAYLIDAAGLKDKLTVFSNMVVFSNYSVQVIMSFLLMSMVFVLWPRADVSAQRIMEVLDTEPIVENGTKTAADVAQASEFVARMDGGYSAAIAQGGSNVSGGQKQRLSIARAVYRHPEILIFDDSFSALDFKTDREVRDALAREAKDSTKLIVAQRIGTIMNADRIVVLDDGKVVGQGTHKELLDNCDVYRQIAESQLSQSELTA